MGYSSLATYKKISPNRSTPRNHKIDTITIHCAVGQMTAKEILNLGHFTKYDSTNGVSCNYAVGKDGSIGVGVDEKDRSWCSSNSANDNRAITIEVASDTTHPYAITKKAYNALIQLCADICERNGIEELKWKANKSLIGKIDQQNMTVHRWFDNKACPGDYIYNLLGTIAVEVNDILNKKPVDNTVYYRVQTGAFRNKAYADAEFARVKAAGFTPYMVKDGALYKIQVGAYKKQLNASNMAKKLKAAGFETNITTKTGLAAPVDTLKSIDEIAEEVKAGKWGNGTDRKNRLTKAGYDYEAVQARVNELS